MCFEYKEPSNSQMSFPVGYDSTLIQEPRNAGRPKFKNILRNTR